MREAEKVRQIRSENVVWRFSAVRPRIGTSFAHWFQRVNQTK